MRKNLRVFRIEKMMSQNEMADKIGFCRATYSAIETGTREGRQAFWEALQQKFDIPDEKMWALKKNYEK